MSFKSLDTGSFLTVALLLGAAWLPILAISFAARASEPKEHPPTPEETYPDEHLFI